VLAVVFSLLLTLYLIIPEAIFRTIFGWYVPPRNFVISRAETAYRALIVAVLPLALAWLGTWYLPLMNRFPFPVNGSTAVMRRSDYKLVTSALYSEAKYGASEKDFWPAFTRCSRRQGRLLAWYMLVIGLEAWGAGYLAANYAKYRSNRLYAWLADKFLFSYISEWHPLLTPYVFVDKETTVQADILCTNDILYQGTVTQHFISDGRLTGIFLTNPRRFNREPYVRDCEAWEKSDNKTKQKPDKENYWQVIPSKNLYFFADKIFNMNLNFKAPAGQVADYEAIRKLLAEAIGRVNLQGVTITQRKSLPEEKKAK
jgi:hypothetical protein